MIKKIFLFIILSIFFANYAYAINNYKKYVLPYGISIEIPKGWEVFNNKKLMQANNALEAMEKDTEMIFASQCYISNEYASASVSINYIHKKLFDKKYFENLKDSDLKEIRDIQTNLSIQMNKKLGNKYGAKYDTNSTIVDKIMIDKINGIKIVKILNTGIVKQIESVYFLPLINSCIKILTTCAENDSHLMEPILNKIISSIIIK